MTIALLLMRKRYWLYSGNAMALPLLITRWLTSQSTIPDRSASLLPS